MKRKVYFTRKPLGIASWSGGKDEEGFSCSTTAYSIRDGRLVREESEEGRDCDGRYSRYWAGAWNGRFRFRVWRNCYWQPIGPGNWPHIVVGLAWNDLDSEQRDYTAEAMGY